MDQMLERLKSLAETETDRCFAQMTTLRIGGRVKYTVYPANAVALDCVLRTLKDGEVPFKLIGKGSDMLCSDLDYDGAVIRLDRHMTEVYFDGDTVTAEAGCSIIGLSVMAMKEGLSGLEFASGIPGTIGGAVFMNAGAYKSSMSEIVTDVLVYEDGDMKWISSAECEFAYRSSMFQKHPERIILAARMKLERSETAVIEKLMKERRERRIASQPLEYPSCGSVFRNPEGANAWQLIDGIGYRGKTVGGAAVSDKHCNFIINKGEATAEDYMTLVNEIRREVREKYAIELHTEMEVFNWNL